MRLLISLQIDLRTPLSTSLTSRLLESQPLAIYYLKKLVTSLNKVTRGLSPARRTSRIEADLETSLTSTVNGTDSFFEVDSQRSTLYREQMGVDHFMGTRSLRKHGEVSDEDVCSSAYTSRSNSQARSSSAVSQGSY